MDPHIAGSDRNDELADSLVTQWNSYGFDSVNIYNYTVLLTFPNKSSLNVLNIVSSKDFNHVLFEANTTLEKPLVDGEDNPNVVPPYNAYSGIGAVNVSVMLNKNTLGIKKCKANNKQPYLFATKSFDIS